jgi:hypothetical protein
VDTGMKQGRGAEPRGADAGISESEIVRAEIQVGNHTVSYERSGRGSPVLLLLCQALAEVGPGATFQALAGSRRVYCPTVPIPRSRDEAERWIRGLVEGLGLGVPDVVADAELAPLLTRLVRRNGGLVGQVLFLPSSRPPAEADAARWVL